MNRSLVLSGFALAVANQGLKGKTEPDRENGILYVLEMLDLNLKGSWMVLLSAVVVMDKGKACVFLFS